MEKKSKCFEHMTNEEFDNYHEEKRDCYFILKQMEDIDDCNCSCPCGDRDHKLGWRYGE